MASFEKRINDNINSGIAGPIWENEIKTFDKIYKKLSEYGHTGYNGVRKYDGIIESGMVSIQEFQGKIIYSIKSEETGFVMLARVSPKQVEFPQYGAKPIMEYGKIEGFKETGDLPLSEVKPTVIETIERTVREHPVMDKYADLILGDFNNILSLDPEREIQPISEEARVNATLKEDNQRKDIQIGRLQTMLNKTLEFARNVRDSIVGKIFFKNQIAQLDMPEGKLPETGADKGER